MKTMKVIGLLAVMLVMVLAFSGTANAFDTHTVKKGDSLWKIGIQYGRNWKEIYKDNKKQIKNPDLIYPGQVFVISDEWDEFSFENPNRDEYAGTPEEALELLDYPEEVSKLFIKKIRKDSFDGWHEISKGDRFAMVFGKNKIRYNTVANWKDDYALLASKKYTVIIQDIEYTLLYPLVCGNWSRLKNIKVPSLPSPKGLVQEIDSKTELEQEKKTAIPLVIPEDKDKEGKTAKGKDAKSSRVFHPEDMLELYVGGGYTDNVHGHIPAHGYYAWFFNRTSPFRLRAKYFDTKIGFNIKASLSEGESGDYSYHGKSIGIGPSFVPYGSTWDWATDITLAWKSSYGGSPGLYRSEQEEKNLILATEYSNTKRRQMGKLSFPKFTLGASYVYPFDVEQRHSWQGNQLEPRPYSSERYEAFGVAWLYDKWFDDGNFRITPGLRLGGGHEFGPDMGFWRAGIPVQFASNDYTILTLSIDFKNQLGGDNDVLIYALSLNAVGLVDAIRTYSIREATEEELNGESKETANEDVINFIVADD